ncbi:MAG: ATP-binding protein [Spirochaetota bacterium]
MLCLLALMFVVQCSVEYSNSFTLTPQEIQYIQTLKEPIIVAPCPDYPPIDFHDENGNFIGLSQDYMHEIEQLLSIKFLKIKIPTWADVLQAAKERKVDIVLSIQDVPERHSYLFFTKPYVRIPNVIVVRKSNEQKLTIKNLKGLHIAAVKGYAVTDYIMKLYPHYNIELVKNEADGLMKLAFGEFDAMILSLSTVSYLVDTYSLTNLRVAGNVGYDWNLCIGVRNDAPLLFSAISKALDSIPQDKKNSIYRKWISLAPKPLYLERDFWIVIVFLLSGVGFVIVGIVIWNASLRNQVKAKTEQLENELYWHKQTQQQLKVEQERLLITIQSIGDAFVTTDENETVILANKYAEELFSEKPIIGKQFHLLASFFDTNKNEIKPVDECLSSKNVKVYHHLQLVINDKILDVSVAASPIIMEDSIIGVVLVIHDITDMLTMQDELVKLQQFESLGILAAGIAHDFNNILTAIMGNTELLAFKYSKELLDSELMQIINGIKSSVKSAQSLTSQLLTYAKGGKPIKKSGNITQLLKETVEFVARGTNVKLKFDIDSSIYIIAYDEYQLSHVFRNLALNAIQAMEDGGVLTVRMQSSNDIPNKINLPKGEYCIIQFSDTGKGIHTENIDKIFNPYFTTKKTGTGLGLTTSLSIVKQHGGTITVTSSNQGTTFTVYLPKNEMSVEFEKNESAQPELLNAFVLILDDRDDILQVTSRMLEILGCNYDTATNSSDAIEKVKLAKQNNKPFTCVLFDVTIPGSLSGVEAFAAIKQIQPDITGIVMSGYSDNSAISDFKKYGFSWYLVKPFTFDELKQALVKAMQ